MAFLFMHVSPKWEKEVILSFCGQDAARSNGEDWPTTKSYNPALNEENTGWIMLLG